MKTGALIICGLILLCCSGVLPDYAGAMVAQEGVTASQQDRTVTGMFTGSTNAVIMLLLPDGTRQAFPYQNSKKLLARIAGVRPGARVQLVIESGQVVAIKEGGR